MNATNNTRSGKLRRIAFVADGKYGNTGRFAQGVSEVAVPKNGFICREFFFADDALQMPVGTLRLPAGMVAWRPDAILYSGTDLLVDDFQELIGQGVPLIVLNHLPRSDIPVVVSDKLQSFALVHDHFADRISSIGLFVTGNPLIYGSIVENYRRFIATEAKVCAIYEFGNTGPLEEIRRTNQVDPDFAKWLRSQPKPLGLFTPTTHVGLFLWHCCRLAKLRVPEDVLIVGIDDFDVANESDPPTTSLRLPLEAMGARGVELAADLLQGAPAPMQINVAGASIIGRRSTLAEPSKEWDLDAALAFIEKHACEGINVEDVRTHTQSMTRESFQRKFVASVGITPRRALEARRMKEARRLLAETEMSPGWIAGMCGYPDYTHFFKLFRKRNGVGPTEFRNAAE